MSELDTAMLRGEIKSLNRLIGLGDDRPTTGDEEQPPEWAAALKGLTNV